MRSNPHTPRGPTLSEVRALVGEGCEGYPPKGPLSLLQRLPGVEAPPEESLKALVAVISQLERVRLTFSHLVLKVPTTHIRGVDMSVTVHLDPIFNVESEKTSPESWRNNPEKL